MVLCTPVAVLRGFTWHVSLAAWPPPPWGRVPHTLALVLQSVLLGGARDIRTVVSWRWWRALLLCNLYNHMKAFVCMCILYMCTCVGRHSVYLYLMHGHAIQTDTALSIRAHPFPVCSQSLLLTLWLLAFTTGFLFTALTCLVSGNHTFLSRFEVAI